MFLQFSVGLNRGLKPDTEDNNNKREVKTLNLQDSVEGTGSQARLQLIPNRGNACANENLC
jgi:hypothetical protein